MMMEGQFKSGHAVFIDNSTERFTPLLEMLDLQYEEGVDWLNDELLRKGIKGRLVVSEAPKGGIAKVMALGYHLGRDLSILPRFIKVFSSKRAVKRKRRISSARSGGTGWI